MKRIVALFLCLLTVIALFASCGSSESANTDSKETSSSLNSQSENGSSEEQESRSESSVESAEVSSSPDSTSPASSLSGEEASSKESNDNDFVDTDDKSDMPVVKSHVMLTEDQLPSKFTLIGTEHLPPISDQGGIGTCASQAITYVQFTNAVSRYLHDQNPDVDWNPSSGNESQIFAPKFTYNYSSAGTVWVYNILKDHGAAPLSICKFYQTPSGYITGDSKYNRQPQSVAWPVESGVMEQALNFRVLNFEQIWCREILNKFTTSDEGHDLLYKIKDAVAQGNVVMTGGFAYSWQYYRMTKDEAKTSSLAKTNDMVAVWCKGTNGGHQVSIVGYDDDLTVTYDGATMKGAFLVANSWGTGWGNKGYFWVMYDAINEVSEFEQLNYEGRAVALDQFCFVYWETDIAGGKPCAYVTAEVEVDDREGFYLELTRTDKTDTVSSYVPYMFTYGKNFDGIHIYDFMQDGEKYMTFGGNADAGPEVGYITLNYSSLVPAGSKFEDYIWGLKVYATGTGVRVRKLSLYDSNGELRAELTPSEELANVAKGSNQMYQFDMGNELRSSHDVGSYKLKNTASGLYCSLHVLLIESCESVLDAATFDVDFDYITRMHTIKMNGNVYILDIMGKTVKDDVVVKFNAKSVSRNTQEWRVVRLEDGTYNIRLACDTRYAMGMKDGKIVLVSGEDIKTYGNWIFENAGSEQVSTTVRYNEEGKLMVNGRIPTAVRGDTVNITVYTTSGESVKNYTVTAEGSLREFSLEINGLAEGNYLFVFKNDQGKFVSANYYVIVK